MLRTIAGAAAFNHDEWPIVTKVRPEFSPTQLENLQPDGRPQFVIRDSETIANFTAEIIAQPKLPRSLHLSISDDLSKPGVNYGVGIGYSLSNNPDKETKNEFPFLYEVIVGDVRVYSDYQPPSKEPLQKEIERGIVQYLKYRFAGSGQHSRESWREIAATVGAY